MQFIPGISKQLKTIVLGVYLDADHATDMVETYTFNVSYPVVGPEIRLESSVAGTKGDSTHVSTLRSSHAEIKKSTQQLMRTLVVLMQTLRPLPVYCSCVFRCVCVCGFLETVS